MKTNTYSKASIRTFFILVILLSAAAEAVICMGGAQWWYILLMWLPAIAAAIANCVCLREEQGRVRLRGLLARSGLHRCRVRYLLAGLLLPLAYLLIPYMAYWLLHPENFAYRGVSVLLILKDCLPPAILGTLVSLLSALGEELGWRGFMVPALYQKMGLRNMLAVTSLFWCCWHLPVLIAGGYMAGAPLWYRLPAFVLCIFPVGVMAALLTVESGSIWPAAFLHAAHNNYDQAILGVITAGEDKMYYVSETGLFTIVCAWALAAVLYLRFQKAQAAKT